MKIQHHSRLAQWRIVNNLNVSSDGERASHRGGRFYSIARLDLEVDLAILAIFISS